MPLRFIHHDRTICSQASYVNDRPRAPFPVQRFALSLLNLARSILRTSRNLFSFHVPLPPCRTHSAHRWVPPVIWALFCILPFRTTLKGITSPSPSPPPPLLLEIPLSPVSLAHPPGQTHCSGAFFFRFPRFDAPAITNVFPPFLIVISDFDFFRC